MKRNKSSFKLRGINYYFFRCDGTYFYDFLCEHLGLEKKNDYSRNRKRIQGIISDIEPDILLLCGAENPYYSLGALDVHNCPVYVILQTLLNTPQRIEMGVGDAYRRDKEIEIFRHAHFFTAGAPISKQKISKYNKDAKFLPCGFPTHRPIISLPTKRDFDFVFFSRIISKSKGIEDVFRAMHIVKGRYINVSINVIGMCNDEYKKKLDEIIRELQLGNNVIFSGYFDSIEEMYSNVVRADAVVVPGITAGLNSTVRESMLLGLPTICYETQVSKNINHDDICLLTAQMGNVDELGKLMILTLENPEYSKSVAIKGKEYAERVFSNETIVNRLIDNCRLIIEKKI